MPLTGPPLAGPCHAWSVARSALGDRLGAALLTVTDAVGASLPLIRRNGGLIVFEVEKLAPYAATP